MNKYFIFWYYLAVFISALTTGVYLASGDIPSSAVMFIFLLFMLRLRKRTLEIFGKDG